VVSFHCRRDHKDQHSVWSVPALLDEVLEVSFGGVDHAEMRWKVKMFEIDACDVVEACEMKGHCHLRLQRSGVPGHSQLVGSGRPIYIGNIRIYKQISR
jgi:hypothetical protein